MAHSASGMAAAALAALTIALVASGCESTQLKNERAKLRATREIAGRAPTLVTRANPDVVVRGRRSAAIVVVLRNRVSRPLTDVPIAVGLGRRVLNARPGLDWFQTHVAAIAPGAPTTWVYSGAPLPAAGRGRPFARAGVPSVVVSRASSLPRVVATATRPAGGRARVLVENSSAVPQSSLQIYVVARDGRRFVAAGRAVIGELGEHSRATVAIPLTGRARGRPLEVHAIPTIFN